MYSKAQLEAAHKISFANKARLKKPQKCGCFYCLKTFSSTEITDWSTDVPDWTALCPYCGIDSVIGEEDGFSLTEDFLEEMYEEWFGN